MMQVHLSRQAAPADWGLGNLLSHTGHGWQIHLPDDSALMALQQAARRIANLGIRDVQLAGSWRKEQQWAFAQGFMPTAGEAGEGTLRWAEGPDADLLELEHRLYCARWVRRLTNLPAQDLGPLELALESAPPSGKVSVEHVINVLSRLNPAPTPEDAQTSLQATVVPLANTARYDSLRGQGGAEEINHA